MARTSFVERAAARLARMHNLEQPLVVDRAEAGDPTSGRTIYRFEIVGAADANGPAHAAILNGRGGDLEDTQTLAALFHRTVLTTAGASRGPVSAPVTIQPDTNILILNPGDTVNETITVTIPKNAAPAKADVYFLADTTGSMGGILNAVQAGANSVLAALGGLGVGL